MWKKEQLQSTQYYTPGWRKADSYCELQQKFTAVNEEWTYIVNAMPLKADIYRTYVFENAVGLIQQYFFLFCIKQPWDKTKTKCLE